MAGGDRSGFIGAILARKTGIVGLAHFHRRQGHVAIPLEDRTGLVQRGHLVGRQVHPVGPGVHFVLVGEGLAGFVVPHWGDVVVPDRHHAGKVLTHGAGDRDLGSLLGTIYQDVVLPVLDGLEADESIGQVVTLAGFDGSLLARDMGFQLLDGLVDLGATVGVGHGEHGTVVFQVAFELCQIVLGLSVDLTEVHTRVNRNPRYHVGFRGFSFSCTANALRHLNADEFKGPGLEGGGLGGAGVERALFAEADLGLSQSG